MNTHHKMLGLAVIAALGGCAAPGQAGTDELNALGGKGDYIARCDATDDPMLRCYGQKEFHSVVPRWDFFPMRTLAAGGTDLEAAARGPQVSRDVVDSDIFKHDPDTGLLYVLNSYRGFQVLDVSSPDEPELLTAEPLRGYPMEMFTQKYGERTYAFVMLNSFEQQEIADSWYGSVLRVYDLGDPAAPVEIAQFPLKGSISGARMLPATNDETGEIVSNVIYVASTVYQRSPLENDPVWEPYSFIKSIDVTSPSMPSEADHQEFRGSNRTLHVTEDAIFLAATEWDDVTSRRHTTIQHVDISDLGGEIFLGERQRVDGSLSWGERGETQLSYFRGHLRVAAQDSGWNPESGDWESRVVVTTIAIPSMDVADSLVFAEGNSIRATKFSGDLAYVFHVPQTLIDPLQIVDLRNPREVRLLSEPLEIDGIVDRIEVLGTKLIGLGTIRDEDGTGRALSLHVFDVEDPTDPVEVGVTTVGESWPWTSANHDMKSFTVLAEQGLVLLPVSESRTDESGRWTYNQWVQLFSFDFDACDANDRDHCVQTRGEIDGAGYARRTFGVTDRVVSIADLELTTADVSNPDSPAITSSFELAADLTDYRVINGAGVLLVGKGDYNNRSAELRVVDAAAPAAGERSPLARLALDTPTGDVHQVGDEHMLIVASDWNSGDTIFTLVSLATPASPRVVGQVRTAELGYNRWRGGFGYYPAPTQSYQVAGEALVAFTFPKECAPEADGDCEPQGAKLRAFSIMDRTERLTLDIGTETVVDMTAEGSTLYVTSYEPVATPEPEPIDPPVILPAGSSDADDPDATAASLLPGASIMPPPYRRTETVAYKLRIFDLSDARAPTVSAAISVPGKYAGTMQHRDGSTILLTMDAFAHEGASVTAFDAMTLDLEAGEVALDDVFGTAEDVDRIFVREDEPGRYRAFFTHNPRNRILRPIPLHAAEPAIAPEEPEPSKLVALTLAQNASAGHSGSRGRVTVRSLGEADLGVGYYTSLQMVEDQLAFVTGNRGRVDVFDVARPRSGMDLLGSFRTSSGWWNGEAYFDGYALYMANGLYGLDVIVVPSRAAGAGE
jgi:hypothetical protein